jgi:hypothetical protein
MAKQIRKGNNWKLGGAHKTIYKQLQVDIQAASIHRRSQSPRTATWGDIKNIYPKVEYNKKFGSRSLGWKSNRCIHNRVTTRRPSRRDGQNQAKNCIRSNGCGKQIHRWRRCVQQ